MRLEIPIPFSSLRIDELAIFAHLGVSEIERAVAQEVRVSLEFRFKDRPLAVFSDSLRDTVCYGELSSQIRSLIQSKEYSLVEKMAGEIFVLAKELSGGAPTSVQVHKVKAPVDGLLGGASFRCGDFL